jgi:hypothetical protein
MRRTATAGNCRLATVPASWWIPSLSTCAKQVLNPEKKFQKNRKKVLQFFPTCAIILSEVEGSPTY